MQVTIPDNVKELIAKRGLKESDVLDVVNTAAQTNHYLKKGTDGLAKKVIGDLTVYALCDLSGQGTAVVKSAYAHKMKLGKIVNVMGESEWKSVDKGHAIATGHVEIEYMTVKRNGPALVCPACNEAWVEEYLATKTLAAAEGLFEAKRA
ncbi:MAG: hypothetical protein E4H30_01550 [Methanomassiliicoccus sp.]|nr:MAG: hypothetical protein E4H30_01550 [Methanomassiliicoccus sp.]